MLAMLMAMVAFSIDAMLPAMPEIAAALSPEAPNSAQLVIGSFVLGLGLGTFFVGPLSDALGRKPVMAAFALLYCIAALLAYLAPSLETLLAARVLQGVGASAARVTTLAIIRDLYAGRAMAQMISFVIMVFTLVPAVAPLLGAGIIAVAGWRAIFLAFLLFAALATTWLLVRQAETLLPARRRALAVGPIAKGYAEALRHPLVRASIQVQVFVFGVLFATISSVQMIFDRSLGAGESFPYWFAGLALVGMLGGGLNAGLVMRVGMRRVVVITLILLAGGSAAVLALTLLASLSPPWTFAVTVGWIACVFASAGLTLGNINAMALDPMGHMAGTASAVITAISNIGAAALAAVVGLAFDGTPVPLMVAVLGFTLAALWLMRGIPPEGATATTPA